MKSNQEFYNLLGIEAQPIPQAAWVLINYNTGNAITSADGVVWDSRYTGRTSIDKIILGNNTLMIDTTVVSTDAVSWSLITGAGANIISSAYSPTLNRYVAIRGSAPLLQYSNDGLTWTTATCPMTSPQDVIWAGGKFVAIGVLTTTAQYAAMVSTDGITWSNSTTTNMIGNWDKIGYSSSLGLYVAVYPTSVVNDKNTIMTSPDGLVWTRRTAPTDGGYTNVRWCSGLSKFVASAVLGNNGRPAYSSNGTTWTTTSLSSVDTWGVAYSSTLNKVLLLGNAQVYQSTDGINFTQLTVGGGNGSIFSGLYINGLGTGTLTEA